ncbi:unnamed protein product [Eretmochelys imbricata]
MIVSAGIKKKQPPPTQPEADVLKYHFQYSAWHDCRCEPQSIRKHEPLCTQVSSSACIPPPAPALGGERKCSSPFKERLPTSESIAADLSRRECRAQGPWCVGVKWGGKQKRGVEGVILPGPCGNPCGFRSSF